MKAPKPIGRSIKMTTNKQKYRTLDESEIAYYKEHPEEITGYLTMAFEAYYEDNCLPSFLRQLRMIAKSKGITNISEITGITRNGIQKSLSETGNPGFESVIKILQALGYGLRPVANSKLTA